MLESALHVPEEEQIGNVDELDRVVDADMQVQETPAALVEHMDDSTGAHRVVSLTDLQHDMIYAGPSSYPLYEYKRTNGSGDPVAESSVD
ncbi:hypothetical protein, partial [Haloferax sp. Atlit-6N]